MGTAEENARNEDFFPRGTPSERRKRHRNPADHQKFWQIFHGFTSAPNVRQVRYPVAGRSDRTHSARKISQNVDANRHRAPCTGASPTIGRVGQTPFARTRLSMRTRSPEPLGSPWEHPGGNGSQEVLHAHRAPLPSPLMAQGRTSACPPPRSQGPSKFRTRNPCTALFRSPGTSFCAGGSGRRRRNMRRIPNVWEPRGNARIPQARSAPATHHAVWAPRTTGIAFQLCMNSPCPHRRG